MGRENKLKVREGSPESDLEGPFFPHSGPNGELAEDRGQALGLTPPSFPSRGVAEAPRLAVRACGLNCRVSPQPGPA